MPSPGSRNRSPRYTTASGKVLFIGAVHEAVPAFHVLLESRLEVVAVVTLTRERARKTFGAVDLESLAQAAGVAVHRTEDLNTPQEVGWVRSLQPDLMVVVGWTRLLGKALLAIPPRGCVGFHASLLPRHRGRAPVNWAIIKGETRTGNTMLFLEAGADTGDIIDQRPLVIDPADTCGTVYDRVGRAGAEMLATHLQALLAGQAPRRSQMGAVSDFLPRRTPAMGITDWARPARAIHDWIRALTHPYPGAYTFLNGRRLFLWASCLPADEPAWQPQPGVLMGLAGDALRVKGSHGSLLITRLEQEGEVEESGADWFVRKGLRRGMCFDAVDPAVALHARGEGPDPAAGRQKGGSR